MSVFCPLHERSSDSLKQDLKSFSSYRGLHLKLAVPIQNWEELLEAYDWYLENPKERSFLPFSEDGRWRWFRCAFGKDMFLNFIRENQSGIPDQPFFAEALHFFKPFKSFGAVIGSPVDFSKTPSKHNDFFLC